MMKELNEFFQSKVEIPAMRHGKSQAIETLINEEAMLLAKHLRNEIAQWSPRIAARAPHIEKTRIKPHGDK